MKILASNYIVKKVSIVSRLAFIGKLRKSNSAGSYSRFLGLAKAALSLVVFITAFVVSVSAQSAPINNIVLVHGAWADGSDWKSVYEILTKDHFNVTIVQEPETSFK